MNVIIQEFDIKVSGSGHPIIKTVEGESMVPTFGFNKKGKVLSIKIGEKEGYAVLQQEWIESIIKDASEDFRKEIVREAHFDGQDPVLDQEEYHREAIPEEVPVYVGIIKRSDYPNEVGIVSSSSSISVENSFVKVKNIKEYKLY